jgi:hypothetical protein
MGFFAAPESITAAYPPNASGLFDLVRCRTSPGSLARIAELDNGHRAEENLADLKRLASGLGCPDGIPKDVMEVISLARWMAPGTDLEEREDCLFACSARNRWSSLEEESHSLDAVGGLASCIRFTDQEHRRLFACRLTALLEELSTPEKAGRTDRDPWGVGLALVGAMVDLGESNLAAEAAEWFAERHNRVWKPGEPAFFIDGFGLSERHFHAIAERILRSRRWPPELELLWSGLARPATKWQRAGLYAEQIRSIAPLLPSIVRHMWRLWRDAGSATKE